MSPPRAGLSAEQLAQLDRISNEWDVVKDGPAPRWKDLESLLDAEERPPSTLTHFTEIKATPVRWLWQDRIALGKLTALSGRPKIGKGLFYSRLISDLTNGRLDGDLGGKNRAIIVTTEDAPGDTLKPRLMAAGADLSRVSMFRMGSKKEPVPFRVPQDADELARRVTDDGSLLVVIDPLMEFLDGKADPHKSKDSRQAVAAITELAAQTGCAVLAVYHLNKGGSNDALLRHEGSAAFTQIIRGGLMLGFDPEDPEGEAGDQRVLASSMSNLSKLAPSLQYRIDGTTVEADIGGDISTAQMRCIGESTVASHELLGAQVDDEQQAEHDEAVEFLSVELADGSVPAGKIKKAADGAGVGPGALKRAKRKLKVESKKAGMSEGWVWSLPEGDATKGTRLIPEKPSPSSPSASKAENGTPQAAQIPEGDDLKGTHPFDDEAERVAEKFPELAA